MNFLKEIAFVSLNWPSFSALGYRIRGLGDPLEKEAFKDQHWIVTGASGGIGASIVKRAAEAGARVSAVARSQEKLNSLVAHCNQGSIEPHVVDLSDMAAIRKWAGDVVESGLKVDVLINNVGILNNQFHLTHEGYEQSYAVNLLGHYILTETLILGDAMVSGGTVVNMASGGLYNVPLNLDYLNQSEDGYDGVAAYASHKRAQLALSDYWRNKYPEANLSFYTMHPGWADTDGVKKSLPAFRAAMRSILRDSDQASDTALWLASNQPDEAENKLWFDRAPRRAHVFPDTVKARTTIDHLVSFLEKDANGIGLRL